MRDSKSIRSPRTEFGWQIVGVDRHREMITNQVRMTIGGKPKGSSYVAPYSHAGGLQFHVVGGVRTEQPVVYEVPIYEVRIDGGGTYLAIRFGVQNTGATPETRRCDAGLSDARDCYPAWVAGYSPHSFRGGSRAGAWRLMPGKGFLIHEGADRAKSQIGGSLGCIEVLDGKWNTFLGEIERIGRGACLEIGSKSSLKVTIESAPFPMAKLVKP
jgi:hypothetical protein